MEVTCESYQQRNNNQRRMHVAYTLRYTAGTDREFSN